MEEKLIFSSSNTIEIDYICSVLKENDIAFVRKTEGAGEYLNIMAGNLFNNTTSILVSNEDYKKAQELVKTITSSNEDIQVYDLPDELKDISKDEEKIMDEEAKMTKNYLKVFILLFIFIPILLFIIAAIIMNK